MGIGGYDAWTPNVEPEFLIGYGSHYTNILLVPGNEGENA
jgi:hypothetical protein